VLYVVGNDQLKGFGLSLTVGLIISLFTSLYMTRDVRLLDGEGLATKLNMMRCRPASITSWRSTTTSSRQRCPDHRRAVRLPWTRAAEHRLRQRHATVGAH
jgi:hypothetical protein